MKYTLIQDDIEFGTFDTILDCLKNVSIVEFYIIAKPSNDPKKWYGISLSTFIARLENNHKRIPWIGENDGT
jgi:hypothetical protein